MKFILLHGTIPNPAIKLNIINQILSNAHVTPIIPKVEIPHEYNITFFLPLIYIL